jgi:hypothetical protein
MCDHSLTYITDVGLSSKAKVVPVLCYIRYAFVVFVAKIFINSEYYVTENTLWIMKSILNSKLSVPT